MLVHVSRRRKDPWYSLDSYQKEWKWNEILRNLFKTIFTLLLWLTAAAALLSATLFFIFLQSLFSCTGFPARWVRFFVFCFIATHSTDTTITLTVQQQHECVGHLFWLLSKLAAGFFVRFLCGFQNVCDPLKMREHNHEENEDKWEHA